jgi:hypothetical protein
MLRAYATGVEEHSMNTLRISGFAAISLFALSACATSQTPKGAAAVPSPPGKEDCLFFSTLRDWAPVDRERLILYGPGGVPYLATLSFPSMDLDYNYSAGFLDYDGDGRICGHGFDSIVLRDAMPNRISITSLLRIEKADAKQLLEATHPKRSKPHKVDQSIVPAASETPATPGGS